MQKLIAGIHKFQDCELGRYQELFHRLSHEGQNPHTLFITCSDSRVLAELITQSQPGDLFVVKNVGNIVPPYLVDGKNNSTAAAIEFAVQTLGVQDVVVCGHSRCGAMKALLEGSQESMPNLNKWLQVAAPVKELIERDYDEILDQESKANAASQENVLFALENLKTYPAVLEKISRGELRLHGWFFEIATAKIFAYDTKIQQFLSIEK